jgi:hypothetical protein
MLEEDRMARNPMHPGTFNCNYTFGRGTVRKHCSERQATLAQLLERLIRNSYLKLHAIDCVFGRRGQSRHTWRAGR